MMIKFMKDRSGITLVELLVGIILIGVVFMIVSTLVIQSFDIFGTTTDRMNAMQLLEIAQSEIVGCLRGAENTTFDRINDNGPWKFKTWCPDGERVEYKILLSNNELSIELDRNDGQGFQHYRRIIGNVEDFDIIENNNVFTVYIETEVDGNTASKNIQVSSRNY